MIVLFENLFPSHLFVVAVARIACSSIWCSSPVLWSLLEVAHVYNAVCQGSCTGAPLFTTTGLCARDYLHTLLCQGLLSLHGLNLQLHICKADAFCHTVLRWIQRWLWTFTIEEFISIPINASRLTCSFKMALQVSQWFGSLSESKITGCLLLWCIFPKM